MIKRIGPNNLIVCGEVTYDEYINLAVACITAPFKESYLKGLLVTALESPTMILTESKRQLTSTDVQAPLGAPSVMPR
eukprot:7173171-Ditylum_brightwellii.AAC.1